LSNRPYVKYWVDPRDGVLKKNTAKTYRQKNQEKEARHQEALAVWSRSLPNGIELRKAQGIWYQVEVFPVPPVEKHEYRRLDGTVVKYQFGGSAYDVILEQQVGINHHTGVKWSTTYCRSKRQLSRSELRRYAVSND
jgi:hypothetical protein